MLFTPGLKCVKAHTYFQIVKIILVRFANAVLPNRTCWKKYMQNLQAGFYANVWLAFTNVDFLLCYQNICKIGNNLHNFDQRVSSRYTEQFHNKNQNCLIAFPINLTVCVLKNLMQSTQNCNAVSRQRIHDVSSHLVGVHKLKISHCRNIFFL